MTVNNVHEVSVLVACPDAWSFHQSVQYHNLENGRRDWVTVDVNNAGDGLSKIAKWNGEIATHETIRPSFAKHMMCTVSPDELLMFEEEIDPPNDCYKFTVKPNREITDDDIYFEQTFYFQSGETSAKFWRGNGDMVQEVDYSLSQLTHWDPDSEVVQDDSSDQSEWDISLLSTTEVEEEEASSNAGFYAAISAGIVALGITGACLVTKRKQESALTDSFLRA